MTSSARAISTSANRSTRLHRSSIGTLAHSACAARAVATAARTSAADMSGTSPSDSPVAGLKLVIVVPPEVASNAAAEPMGHLSAQAAAGL